MQAMAHIMPSLFPSKSDPYHQIVSDFVQCFQLQENPEPRVICDALMIAVDNGMHRLPNLLGIPLKVISREPPLTVFLS